MYYLMNKNVTLLDFEIVKENVHIVRQREDSKKFGVDPTQLQSWLRSRVPGLKSFHSKKIMEATKLNKLTDIVNKTLCLSLDDSLWVKRSVLDIPWEKISLHRSPLNEAISKVFFSGTVDKDIDDYPLYRAPEISTKSDSPFKYVRDEEGNLVLVRKDGQHHNSFAFDIASQLCSHLGFRFVPSVSVPTKNKTETHSVICTSEDTGSVSTYSHISGTNFFKVKEYYDRLGDSEGFAETVLFDILARDNDTVGWLAKLEVDNNTGKIIGSAPLDNFNFAFNFGSVNSLCRKSKYMDVSLEEAIKAVLTPDLRRALGRIGKYKLEQPKGTFVNMDLINACVAYQAIRIISA